METKITSVVLILHTVQKNGLLLHISNKTPMRDFLEIYMLNGKICAMVNTGTAVMELQSRIAVNSGTDIRIQLK